MEESGFEHALPADLNAAERQIEALQSQNAELREALNKVLEYCGTEEDDCLGDGEDNPCRIHEHIVARAVLARIEK